MVGSRVKKYVELLVNLYKDSSLEFVFVSSVLERIYKDSLFANLEIYFAFVNSCLKTEITKLNNREILNKDSKVIYWKFINVSKQFFEATSPELIFRETSGNLIHRTNQCMCDLLNVYLQKIHETLVVKGAINST